nr:hypothetical protein [Bradyrhizobium sp. sGM-13]
MRLANSIAAQLEQALTLSETDRAAGLNAIRDSDAAIETLRAAKIRLYPLGRSVGGRHIQLRAVWSSAFPLRAIRELIEAALKDLSRDFRSLYAGKPLVDPA